MAKNSEVGHEERFSSGLIAHIQGANEQEKAVLARELHDELGGLLVGAVMDLAWAEQHIGAPAADVKQKLTRARQTLSAAIDLKRRLIEELRPTLLDNVGLFAALRWHAQSVCKRSGLICHIILPEEERRFLPNIPIALFRVAQEAFAVVLASSTATSTSLEVNFDGSLMTLRIITDAPISARGVGDGNEAHLLAAIDYRTVALGGSLEYAHLPTGGARLAAMFPLEGILLPAQS